MKLKKSQLKRLINEELYKALSEAEVKRWGPEGDPMIPNPDTGGWQQDPNLSSRTEESFDFDTLRKLLHKNIFEKRYEDADGRIDPRLNALARWRRIEKALEVGAQQVYAHTGHMDLYWDDDAWLQNRPPRPRPEMTFRQLANALGLSEDWGFATGGRDRVFEDPDSGNYHAWEGEDFVGVDMYTKKPLKRQGLKI